MAKFVSIQDVEKMTPSERRKSFADHTVLVEDVPQQYKAFVEAALDKARQRPNTIDA